MTSEAGFAAADYGVAGWHLDGIEYRLFVPNTAVRVKPIRTLIRIKRAVRRSPGRQCRELFRRRRNLRRPEYRS